MKKNVASQSIGAQMVDATTGAAFTSTTTVYVTGDNGTQAIGSVGSGVCTHEGNGYHSYAPAQAETNYDHIAFTFIGTGAIPATVQLYTDFPQTGDSFARVGAPVGASISADVAAVKTQTAAIEVDTQDIQTRLPAALVSGRIDASVGAMAANTITAAAAAADFGTEVGTAVWATTTRVLTAGTNIVLAKGTGITGFNDIAAADVWAVGTRVLTAGTNIVLAKGVGITGFNDLDAAGVRGAVGLASANLDTQLSTMDGKLDTIVSGASVIITDLGTIEGKVDIIDANVDTILTDVGNVPTASENADALLDRANGIETGYTPRQSMRLILSATAAKLSGAATTNVLIRDVNDTKNRIDATVDADGNRTAVTLDAS